MYNDYHVIDASTGGKTYPRNVPATAPRRQLHQQLQHELQDERAGGDAGVRALRSLGFVQPTVVPTVTVTFAPSPLTVKSAMLPISLR